MNNHSYPTLSPQPIQPYPGMIHTQSYNAPTLNNPITVGIPVNNINMPKPPMQAYQAHIPRPTPPVQQPTHNYIQLPQHQVNHGASPYYTSQKPVQHQNSNIREQNGCYIELTDNNVPEPAYAPSETKREENTMITGSNMPHIQYPQLPGPMGPMTPSYSYQMTPNPDMSGPVIYDASLLEGVTSREPQMCRCARCNRYVQTVVHYKTGKGAILSGVFMGCMGGMPLLCSWVPCVLKEFKDAIHHCPVCGDQIGKKKFLLK